MTVPPRAAIFCGGLGLALLGWSGEGLGFWSHGYSMFALLGGWLLGFSAGRDR